MTPAAEIQSAVRPPHSIGYAHREVLWREVRYPGRPAQAQHRAGHTVTLRTPNEVRSTRNQERGGVLGPRCRVRRSTASQAKAWATFPSPLRWQCRGLPPKPLNRAKSHPTKRRPSALRKFHNFRYTRAICRSPSPKWLWRPAAVSCLRRRQVSAAPCPNAIP